VGSSAVTAASVDSMHVLCNALSSFPIQLLIVSSLVLLDVRSILKLSVLKREKDSHKNNKKWQHGVDYLLLPRLSRLWTRGMIDGLL
jgi:hypothetical protein